MKWVTRSFPGVDRTATAWLIKKFIDPEAEFIFINWPEEKLKPEHGIPFDIKGVELGHKDNKCTFEVVIEKYSIKNPYAVKIAKIIHAADIEGEIDKVPEARGIRAVFNGLRFVTKLHKEKLKLMSRTERLRFIKSMLKSRL